MVDNKFYIHAIINHTHGKVASKTIVSTLRTVFRPEFVHDTHMISPVNVSKVLYGTSLLDLKNNFNLTFFYLI